MTKRTFKNKKINHNKIKNLFFSTSPKTCENNEAGHAVSTALVMQFQLLWSCKFTCKKTLLKQLNRSN